MIRVSITRNGFKVRAAIFGSEVGPNELLAADWARAVIRSASVNDSADFAYTVATVEPLEAARLREVWEREAEAFARLG